MNSSTNTSENVPLTLNKLKEAMKLLDELPRTPFIIYSWAIPHDQVFYGDIIDRVAKTHYPAFNPRWQKAYLVSKHWEELRQDNSLAREEGH